MNILDWANSAQLKSTESYTHTFHEIGCFGKAHKVDRDFDEIAGFIEDCGFDTWIVHVDGGWIAFATQVHDNMDKGNFWVQVGRDDAWFKTLTEAQIYLWENHSKHEVGATS